MSAGYGAGQQCPSPPDLGAPFGTFGLGLGRVHTGGVSLLIRHENGAYHLAVSPPETAESHEATVGTPTEVLEVLSRWGCHSTAITDALYEADPSWAVTHDAEVLRRRGQAPESE